MNNKIELINNLIKLIDEIDIKNINLNLIKLNIDKLTIIYSKLIDIWHNIDITKIKSKVYAFNNSKYLKIKSILINSIFASNINIKNKINNSKYIHCLKYFNIKLYWLSSFQNIDILNQDYILALKMIKISICLNLYKYQNLDNIERIIIWIPINKERNFNYSEITQFNLKKTEDDFEAFVPSGLTYGNSLRITIITRYEEVEKLLIHELIHNYYIDGSNYHIELKYIINKYRIQKNNKNTYRINFDYEYSIYESYTELLSTYFYLLFKNLLNNINIIDIQDKLLGQIIIELLYSYNLICNLSILNGYKSYITFKNNFIFEGNICIYEYYLIKALMYNNFILIFGNKLDDFQNIYKQIYLMIKKIKLSDDILLNQIYQYYKKQKNFKYQIH